MNTLTIKMGKYIANNFFEGDALSLALTISKDRKDLFLTQIHGVDLNQIHKKDMTLLFFALLNKKYWAIESLIKSGANPMQKDREMGTPLRCAILSDDPEILRAMLRGGVSPDTRSQDGTPILFDAASEGDGQTLHLLIEAGANVSAIDSLGTTAAVKAFHFRRFDRVALLIRSGARLDLANIRGITLANEVEHFLSRCPLDSPVRPELLTIRKLMIDRGILFPAEPQDHP